MPRFQVGHKINLRHGEAVNGKDTPEYVCWMDMKARCLNLKHKHFKYYGGRGIAICERWKTSFENFLADVGRRPSPKHTIDRFPNSDGNYEPNNIRWATRAEQTANRTITRMTVLNGEAITVAEACRRLGLNLRTVSHRISAYGWTIERSLAKRRTRAKAA